VSAGWYRRPVAIPTVGGWRAVPIAVAIRRRIRPSMRQRGGRRRRERRRERGEPQCGDGRERRLRRGRRAPARALPRRRVVVRRIEAVRERHELRDGHAPGDGHGRRGLGLLARPDLLADPDLDVLLRERAGERARCCGAQVSGQRRDGRPKQAVPSMPGKSFDA
jgi:hypothetical protein